MEGFIDTQEKIRQLAEHLARKEVQLAKAMRVAEAAVADLKKYMVLTTTDKGARDVVLNVRKLHHARCPDTGKGCDYDLGFIAWIAISFGMDSHLIDLNKLKVMMEQHEALIKQEKKPGGKVISIGARPTVGEATVVSAKPKPQVKTKVHVFKGPPNDRRPVQPGSKEATMRLSRSDLLPLLTFVSGGVIGASLSFSFLALTPSGDVPAPRSIRRWPAS